MRFVLPLILLAGLTACQAPILPYQAPSGPATAQLVIRNGPAHAQIMAFDDVYVCQGPRDLALLLPDQKSVSRVVRTDRPVTVRVVQTLSNKNRCVHAVSFLAKEKHRYLLRLNVTGNICTVGLLDATDPTEAIPEEAFIIRTPKPVLRDGVDGCEKQTEPSLRKRLQDASEKRMKAAISLDDFKDLLPN
jgi:hypothetical protein